LLDFIEKGRSITIKGKGGLIVQAIGAQNFTLLELLAMYNVKFEPREKLYLGRGTRDKILSVLGRLTYNDLTPIAIAELPDVCEKIVKEQEERFVRFFNEARPLTPRLHALELLPGIGKTYLSVILKERKEPFTSFNDLEKRVGLKNVSRLISRRIVEELKGDTRVFIFVKPERVGGGVLTLR